MHRFVKFTFWRFHIKLNRLFSCNFSGILHIYLDNHIFSIPSDNRSAIFKCGIAQSVTKRIANINTLSIKPSVTHIHTFVIYRVIHILHIMLQSGFNRPSAIDFLIYREVKRTFMVTKCHRPCIWKFSGRICITHKYVGYRVSTFLPGLP